MKTTTLGEVLTADQVEGIIRIIELYPDSSERVNRIKKYLEPMRDSLLKKGVELEYLAYCIENLALSHCSGFAQK